MLPKIIKFIVTFFIFTIFLNVNTNAQKTNNKKDSLKQEKYTPKISFLEIFKPDKKGTFKIRKASYRSLILPGWGQAYNKKYWKIPLAGAAIGIPIYFYVNNKNQYKSSNTAYLLASDNDISNNSLIADKYKSVADRPEIIRSYRNQARLNMDFSILALIICWGVNVADATVDAHLKSFNISDDLSLQINAGYSPIAQTNGIQLKLKLGKK